MSDEPTAPAPAATAPPTPRIRVSDADRADTVARLQAAFVEGRLDLDEIDERVTAAFAARYDTDLELLVADLPPHGGAPSWSAVWASAVWRARILVLGAADGGRTAPTSEQCRSAVGLAVLAVAWFLACAFAGAAMVA